MGVEAAARSLNNALPGVSAEALERCGLRDQHILRVARYRGLAFSRLVPDEIVGSAEFVDGSGREAGCWPAGYADHYVKDHGVVPSVRFIDYIEGLDLAALEHVAQQAMRCAARQEAGDQTATMLES